MNEGNELWGERLLALMKLRKTRKARLAEYLSVNKSTITRYSQGRLPDAETLRKIASYLSVTTDYLLGLTDSPMPPAAGKTGAEQSRQQAYLEALATKSTEPLNQVRGKTATESPGLEAGAHAKRQAILYAFHEYLQGMEPWESEWLLTCSSGDRVQVVVDFLCRSFPESFTPAMLADLITAAGPALSAEQSAQQRVLRRIVEVTGIPRPFFTSGDVDSVAALVLLSQAEGDLLAVIGAAIRSGIPTAELAGLIRSSDICALSRSRHI